VERAYQSVAMAMELALQPLLGALSQAPMRKESQARFRLGSEPL